VVDEFESIGEDIKTKIEAAQYKQMSQLKSQLFKSVTICLYSCKLLTFNVEDILALPQIKEGRLYKNIQQTDISKSVMEIVQI